MKKRLLAALVVCVFLVSLICFAVAWSNYYPCDKCSGMYVGYQYRIQHFSEKKGGKVRYVTRFFYKYTCHLNHEHHYFAERNEYGPWVSMGK